MARLTTQPSFTDSMKSEETQATEAPRETEKIADELDAILGAEED